MKNNESYILQKEQLVDNSEEAHFRALIEDAYRIKAEAYRNYLLRPETYLRTEQISLK